MSQQQELSEEELRRAKTNLIIKEYTKNDFYKLEFIWTEVNQRLAQMEEASDGLVARSLQVIVATLSIWFASAASYKSLLIFIGLGSSALGLKWVFALSLLLLGLWVIAPLIDNLKAKSYTPRGAELDQYMDITNLQLRDDTKDDLIRKKLVLLHHDHMPERQARNKFLGKNLNKSINRAKALPLILLFLIFGLNVAGIYTPLSPFSIELLGLSFWF